MAKKNKEGAVVKEHSSAPMLENPEDILFRLSSKESPLVKYKSAIIGGVVVLVVAAAGFFGYQLYLQKQNEEAQTLLYPAVNYFEADSLNKALKGDGTNEGLTAIAEDFGASKAGDLADFYAGVAYLKQGKFDDAIQSLKDFSSSDLVVQARAYSLIGDAYMEKKDTKEAINYYQKAVDYKPNKYFTPVYLMKLAAAFEADKNYSAAVEAYNQIIDKYFDSSEVINAKKYKSKLEGLANN